MVGMDMTKKPDKINIKLISSIVCLLIKMPSRIKLQKVPEDAMG